MYDTNVSVEYFIAHAAVQVESVSGPHLQHQCPGGHVSTIARGQHGLVDPLSILVQVNIPGRVAVITVELHAVGHSVGGWFSVARVHLWCSEHS